MLSIAITCGICEVEIHSMIFEFEVLSDSIFIHNSLCDINTWVLVLVKT